jgi:hypothetical protein
MLQTVNTGANPTWNQPLSSDGVLLAGAHYIQSFAFLNNGLVSVVVFNLNQTTALPVTFSGVNAPSGTVQMSQITSGNITDNNETAETVQTKTKTLSGFNPSTSLSLPPFSMTVLTGTSSAVQVPAFSIPSGTYSTAQEVSIADGTSGATVHYTTDGSTPTASSSTYAAPITITGNATLKAIATVPGLTPSAVASAAFVISKQAAATTPAFSVKAGTYGAAVAVAISDSTAGATIYYTVNGATPTTASAKYSSPISVSASETIKAIAIAANYSASAVATASYAINLPSTGEMAGQISLLGSAKQVGETLQLTNGAQVQAGAAWNMQKVSTTTFTTDFTFRIPVSYADGFTFTVQNSPQGYKASGGNGNALGYAGIARSIGLKFGLYDGSKTNREVSQIGLLKNGASPSTSSVDVSSKMNFHSGHIFHVELVYSGTTLKETVTDTATKAAFSQKYSVNIPSILGSKEAFVGFTGSTGAFTSVQDLLTWTYSGK